MNTVPFCPRRVYKMEGRGVPAYSRMTRQKAMPTIAKHSSAPGAVGGVMKSLKHGGGKPRWNRFKGGTYSWPRPQNPSTQQGGAGRAGLSKKQKEAVRQRIRNNIEAEIRDDLEDEIRGEVQEQLNDNDRRVNAEKARMASSSSSSTCTIGFFSTPAKNS